MDKRINDSSNIIQFRLNLYSETLEGFFFKSREGISFGPYQNLKQAQVARQLFIYSLTGNQLDKPNLSNKHYNQLFSIEEVELQA